MKTTTDDTWENRVKSVASVLNTTSEIVESKLKDWGIERDPMGLEMLDDDDVTKFGDFQNIFGTVQQDGPRMPLAKLRLAFKFLKGGKRAEERQSVDPRSVELKTAFGIKPTLDTADVGQLLRFYDPTKPNDPVTVALQKRFGSKKVIAFKIDSREVDVETSANYIADHTMGVLDDSTEVLSESTGRLVRLYAVGQVPDLIVDEDPLFPGHALRNDRSLINHISWKDISYDARVLCRLTIELNLIDVNDRVNVTNLLTLAKKGSEGIAGIYPEVDLEYRERSRKDKLPRLKIDLAESTTKTNDPFKVNRRY